MPIAKINDMELYYETSGPVAGAPLVLIHGLGAQMIAWFPEFVHELETVGFNVIRFDNRDVGLSSKLEGETYTLDDMASDVVGLIEHLGLTSAHIAGISMGGMIVQQLCIGHSASVRSATIMNSAPGMAYITDDQEVWELRRQPPPTNREEAIERYIASEEHSGLSERYGHDKNWIAGFAVQVVDRCYYPDGAKRQEEATRGAPGRLEALKSVTIPTAVISSREDRLISYRAGIDMAEAIPGAELHVYAGAGHQLVPALYREWAYVMRRTAERAGRFTA